jgi:hypothetical protein
MLTAPPSRLLDEHGHVAQFGMWNAPLPDVDLLDAVIPNRPGPLARLRLKRWQHVLVVHPDASLMWAVVDAAYLKVGWVRFVDRRSEQTFEHATKSPLLDAGIARALHDDRTWLRSRGLSIEMHNHLAEGRHTAAVEASGKAPSVEAELSIQATSTPLVVNLPLGRGRSMYSHKVVHPVSGHFVADGRRYDCDPATTFAIFDIHQAHYPRRTYWNWATFVGVDDDGVVGLNLTRNVVADPAYHENALWLDGELSLLEQARFDFSDDERWTVGTIDDRVDLTFTAQGERREDIRAVVMTSVFRQRFGTFSGRVGDRTIRDAFGLMEDHKSTW